MLQFLFVVARCFLFYHLDFGVKESEGIQRCKHVLRVGFSSPGCSPKYYHMYYCRYLGRKLRPRRTDSSC